MKQAVRLAAVLAVSWCASPARAQSLDQVCAGVSAAYAQRCVAVAQAAEAAQPRLGIVLAAGSPALGVGTGPSSGDRPRFRASGRLNLAVLHMPDIVLEDDGLMPQPSTGEMSVFTVVLGGNASVGVLEGANGIGSVDLLLSAAYLPFDLIGREVYKPASAQFSVGAGARLGLLRESTTAPDVSVTLMYRRTGAVQIGNTCEGDEENVTSSTATCRWAGDAGEVHVDLAGLSGRAVLGKTLGPVGLAAGVGYDRYASDLRLDIRGERVGSGLTGSNRIYHRTAELESDRWSGFLNATTSVVAGGSLVAEVGWMQGGEAVAGYAEDADFDPASGTWFGSLGARLPL